MLSLLLLLACSVPPEEKDTGDPADTDTDTDTDADTDTDTDTGGNGSGLLQYIGSALVVDTYAGTEEAVFVADDGEGEDLCRVSVELVSTASRDDCEVCQWAFDLEVIEVVTVTDIACAAVGWDTPETLVGTTRAYGYTPDYYGHAPALLASDGTTWQPLGYAFWDPETGELRYSRDEGYYSW